MNEFLVPIDRFEHHQIRKGPLENNLKGFNNKKEKDRNRENSDRRERKSE